MIIEKGLSGGQASYSFTGPYPGDSVFHTLFSDDKDHFYLGYYKEGASKNEFANHVFRLDARTGANEYLGEGRVSEVAGGLLFLRESSPFPRVIIFRHAMPCDKVIGTRKELPGGQEATQSQQPDKKIKRHAQVDPAKTTLLIH